jgi:hypothetical protein
MLCCLFVNKALIINDFTLIPPTSSKLTGVNLDRIFQMRVIILSNHIPQAKLHGANKYNFFQTLKKRTCAHIISTRQDRVLIMLLKVVRLKLTLLFRT